MLSNVSIFGFDHFQGGLIAIFGIFTLDPFSNFLSWQYVVILHIFDDVTKWTYVPSEINSTFKNCDTVKLGFKELFGHLKKVP